MEKDVEREEGLDEAETVHAFSNANTEDEFNSGPKFEQNVDDMGSLNEELDDDLSSVAFTHDGNIDVEEIANSRGNYVLTIGLAGAGKSTFHSHLLRMLNAESDYVAESVGNDSNGASNRILNRWRTLWTRNEYPDGTTAGEDSFIEIKARVGPANKKSPTIDLSLLEMSGETLSKVMPDFEVATRGVVPSVVHACLENPHSRKIIVFVIDPTQGVKNENLISNFLNYLHLLFDDNGQAMRRMGFVMLLAKPEAVLKTKSSMFSNIIDERGVEFDRSNAWQEIQNIAPSAKNLESKCGLGFIAATLKVGHDSAYLGDDARSYGKPLFHDTDKVFRWIYTFFTHHQIGKRNGLRGSLDKLIEHAKED